MMKLVHFKLKTLLILWIGIIQPVFFYANGVSVSASKSIKIPFHYIQSFIILDVQLEKLLPVRLIFDTGAEHTILFEHRWTDLIEHSYLREIKVIGSDLQQELPAMLTCPLNLMFDERYEFTSSLIVLKENTTNISQVIGEPIHGILSASVFSKYLIEIDYRNQYLILHSRDYAISSMYNEVDLDIYKNKPYLKVRVNFKDTCNDLMNLLLDTGASLSLLMYSDSSSAIRFPDKLIPGYLGSGIGGLLTGYVGKINALQLDTFLLPGVITHFLKVQTVYAHNERQRKNGLIGNQILDKFNIIFDYQKEKLYLRPVKNYKEVLAYDKSGMLVISGGKDLRRYFVAYVVPGTPAAEAGVQENDEIVKFNGWPASFYSMAKINLKLQGKTDKKINITVKRDGKKIKFNFRLRPLI